MLKMRFKRCGKKQQPTYKIVIMLSTSGRDSRAIKNLGFYNPITKEIIEMDEGFEERDKGERDKVIVPFSFGGLDKTLEVSVEGDGWEARVQEVWAALKILES
jgi:ribosomal protein S16